MKKKCQENFQQTALEDFGYEQELNRVLKTKDLVIYGLIIMVPIAPFGIYGIVNEAASGMAALAYLLGMLAMLFTAFSYARMAEAIPIAGSVYCYASKGLNTTVGFFAGWAILLDYAFIPALLYLLSGAALHDMMPSVPIFLWAFIFIICNTLINIRGIEMAAKVNKVLLVLQLIILTYFVICGVIGIAHGVNGAEFSLKPLFNSNLGLSAVMPGVAICVLSYLGFDGISTLAEENQDGGGTIGKATVIALLVCGIIFVIQCWVAGMAYPDWHAFKDPNTSFYVVAFSVGGNALKLTCEIGITIALGFACALSFQTAVSRVLFSMSRDGLMPKAFSKIHPKFKTPYVATIFVAVIAIIVCSVFSEMIDILSCLVNFGALTSFAILHVAVINYFVFKTKKYNFFQHIVLPTVGFIIIVYVWIHLAIMSKIIGLVWLTLGTVYYLVLTFVLKRDTSKMQV
ncbi:APC family permease [Clostridium sp. MT-14]|uniref:Amino acid permease n=1 Tax=Clostridium aromativorans TaxID=2836848 RepID=A0ABS8N8T0_9CLOT|nr:MULTISPECIES: amino acid permease [Clostridium]KAA8669424.1 amino acid permease [Clostridium sp. HV4-5-A1G]MCC9296215.1 amino acid permease [Clostridium aromativorans]CAB1244720.1 Amino acid permease [Clostridiaceae bacterium BL-3]